MKAQRDDERFIAEGSTDEFYKWEDDGVTVEGRKIHDEVSRWVKNKKTQIFRTGDIVRLPGEEGKEYFGQILCMYKGKPRVILGLNLPPEEIRDEESWWVDIRWLYTWVELSQVSQRSLPKDSIVDPKRELYWSDHIDCGRNDVGVLEMKIKVVPPGVAKRGKDCYVSKFLDHHSGIVRPLKPRELSYLCENPTVELMYNAAFGYRTGPEKKSPRKCVGVMSRPRLRRNSPDDTSSDDDDDNGKDNDGQYRKSSAPKTPPARRQYRDDVINHVDHVLEPPQKRRKLVSNASMDLDDHDIDDDDDDDDDIPLSLKQNSIIKNAKSRTSKKANNTVTRGLVRSRRASNASKAMEERLKETSRSNGKEKISTPGSEIPRRVRSSREKNREVTATRPTLKKKKAIGKRVSRDTSAIPSKRGRADGVTFSQKRLEEKETQARREGEVRKAKQGDPLKVPRVKRKKQSIYDPGALTRLMNKLKIDRKQESGDFGKQEEGRFFTATQMNEVAMETEKHRAALSYDEKKQVCERLEKFKGIAEGEIERARSVGIALNREWLISLYKSTINIRKE